MNAFGYVLGLYALKRFRDLGLEERYQEEIEAWLLHAKQEKFSKQLDKQILNEIDRFMKEKMTIEELMKERFPEPKWIIEDNR